MKRGVPQSREPLSSGSLAASRRPLSRAGRRALRAGILLLGMSCSLLVASSALGATATVGLGTATSFSVLAGSTVTNTGATTMSGDLGLSPGSEVTGSELHVLGQRHVDDAVAIGAKNALTTAFVDAASRPSNGSAGTDLSGQTFLPGVREATSSLLLSSGRVTLDAVGDPNAVFIFKIGTALTTEANTEVLLINGAKPCNVFWQVGSSATLGTGTRFVGTVMAGESITATTGATIEGRLLAQVGAVTLDTNTITTSTCATEGGGSETTTGGGSGSTGGGGSSTGTTTTGAGTTAAGAAASGAGTPVGAAATGAPRPPVGSRTTAKKHRRPRHPSKRASTRRSPARPALRQKHGEFTG